MSKRKKSKALKRAKQRKKEIRAHRGSYHGIHPSRPDIFNVPIEHLKPLSKEEVLAERKAVP